MVMVNVNHIKVSTMKQPRFSIKLRVLVFILSFSVTESLYNLENIFFIDKYFYQV